MWGRVAIGTRMYADPKAEFVQSLLALMRDGLRDGDKVLDPVVRWNVVSALRMVFERFLASDCDSLLILEDDVVFRPTDLDNLRAAGSGYGILSALYPARRWPFNPQIFRSVLRSKNYVTELKGLVNVEAVAFGFCLMRRATIEAVAARNKSRVSRWGAVDECFSFCEDARILGFKIAVNTEVSVGHVVPATPVYWNAAENKAEVKHESD